MMRNATTQKKKTQVCTCAYAIMGLDPKDRVTRSLRCATRMLFSQQNATTLLQNASEQHAPALCVFTAVYYSFPVTVQNGTEL